MQKLTFFVTALFFYAMPVVASEEDYEQGLKEIVEHTEACMRSGTFKRSKFIKIMPFIAALTLRPFIDELSSSADSSYETFFADRITKSHCFPAKATILCLYEILTEEADEQARTIKSTLTSEAQSSQKLKAALDEKGLLEWISSIPELSLAFKPLNLWPEPACTPAG